MAVEQNSERAKGKSRRNPRRKGQNTKIVEGFEVADAVWRLFTAQNLLANTKNCPKTSKDAAERHEEMFRNNPFDARLKTHKLHGPFEGFLAFLISHKYRIIFEFSKDQKKVYFHSVGDHDIYQ